MNTLDKATEGDKRRILDRAVYAKFGVLNEYTYIEDYDDTHVFWEVWVAGTYTSFKSSYTFSGVTAIVGDDKAEVIETTEFVEVAAEVDKSFSDKVVAVIDKHFGGSKSEGKPLIKQLDDELMIAVEPLYIAIGDVDGVGDTYASPEVCHDMVASFNKAIEDGTLQANYFHKVPTEDFTILKAWVTETDSIIGDTEIKEGLPLVKIQFNKSEAWEERKSGGLKGVSIGATATWEEV